MKLSEVAKQRLFELTICADRPRDGDNELIKHGLAEAGQGRFGAWVRVTKRGVEHAAKEPWDKRNARSHEWHEKITSHAFTESDKTSVGGGRATSARGPGDTGRSIVAVSDGCEAEASTSLGRAPRPSRRNGAKQAKVGASALVARQQPPASSLQAGAATKNQKPRPDRARSPQASDAPRQPTPTAVKQRKPRTYSRGAGANNDGGSHTRREKPRSAALEPTRSRAPSTIQPNAVRVQIGNNVTYYPLTSYEAIKHGTKHRVRTLNKLYKQFSLEASGADLIVSD